MDLTLNLDVAALALAGRTILVGLGLTLAAVMALMGWGLFLRGRG